MWRTAYSADWSRKKAYLIRSLFQDEPPTILSPVPEEPDSFSDSDNANTRPHSPLPELIIEKEKNKHDEPEEYYQKLEVKIKRICKQMFVENRSISDCDFNTTESNFEETNIIYDQNDDISYDVNNAENKSSTCTSNNNNSDNNEEDSNIEEEESDNNRDITEERTRKSGSTAVGDNDSSKQESTNKTDANGYSADAEMEHSDSESENNDSDKVYYERLFLEKAQNMKNNLITEKANTIDVRSNIEEKSNEPDEDFNKETCNNRNQNEFEEIKQLNSHIHIRNETNVDELNNENEIEYLIRNETNVDEFNNENAMECEDDSTSNNISSEGAEYRQITTQAQVHIDGETQLPRVEIMSQEYDEIVTPNYDDIFNADTDNFVRPNADEIVTTNSNNIVRPDDEFVRPYFDHIARPNDDIVKADTDVVVRPHSDTIVITHSDNIAGPNDEFVRPHSDNIARPNDEFVRPHSDNIARPNDEFVRPHSDNIVRPNDEFVRPHSDNIARPNDEFVRPHSDNIARPNDEFVRPHSDNIARPNDEFVRPHSDNIARPNDEFIRPHSDNIARPNDECVRVPEIMVDEYMDVTERRVSATGSEPDSGDLDKNIDPQSISKSLAETPESNHSLDSVEVMRTPVPDRTIRGSAQFRGQRDDGSSCEKTDRTNDQPELSLMSMVSQDPSRSPTQEINMDIDELLSTIINNSTEKTITPSRNRKRKSCRDMSVQTSQNETWDNIRDNFFVGAPKILRLCSCAVHVCNT